MVRWSVGKPVRKYIRFISKYVREYVRPVRETSVVWRCGMAVRYGGAVWRCGMVVRYGGAVWRCGMEVHSRITNAVNTDVRPEKPRGVV